MTDIIHTFPVTEARQALQDFRNLAAAFGPMGKGTDARHIIKLLAGAPAPDTQLRGFLRFLDDSAAAWPALVRKLLQQTSESQFRQSLAELRVLSHLNKQTGVEARPTNSPKHLKHHDIDATAADVTAKIEIYSPSDGGGLPLFDQQLSSLFKFLNVPIGFHLDLMLEPLSKAGVTCASDVGTSGQVERWLTKIRAEAEIWIKDSPAAGSSKSWDGPNKSVRLTTTIRKISEDLADRVVRIGTETRSTDSRSLFDHGDPRQLRLSSWGRKVFDKMSERQCGEYEHGRVRLLIIDFSGLGLSAGDHFRITDTAIFSRIESALQMATADAGEPKPYDGAVLAWVDDPIVFAPAIALHLSAAVDLQKFVSGAALATH